MAVTVADEQRQEPVKPLEDVQEERSDGPLPEVGSVQDQQDVVGHVQQMGEVEHLKMVSSLSSKFTVVKFEVHSGYSMRENAFIW